MNRGDVWLANLGPVIDGEQAGRRPIVVFEHNPFVPLWSTVVAIPFTTNLHRAGFPTCLRVGAGEGGLSSDSVALCHQIRAIDKRRLIQKMGVLSAPIMAALDRRVTLTLGM